MYTFKVEVPYDIIIYYLSKQSNTVLNADIRNR